MIIIGNGKEEKPVLDFSSFLTENPDRDAEILRQRKEQEDAERLEAVKATGIPERYWKETIETYNGNGDQVVQIGQFANASKSIYCGVLVNYSEDMGLGKRILLAPACTLTRKGDMLICRRWK